MPKSTDKPLVYGNVDPSIRDLFNSWVAALPKSKQRGLLMTAAIMTAANHPDERDSILAQLIQADAMGHADQIIAEWVNENSDETGPSMFEQSRLKMPTPPRSEKRKPRRAARTSRHKKLPDDSTD